jgi:hypothetical protein
MPLAVQIYIWYYMLVSITWHCIAGISSFLPDSRIVDSDESEGHRDSVPPPRSWYYCGLRLRRPGGHGVTVTVTVLRATPRHGRRTQIRTIVTLIRVLCRCPSPASLSSPSPGPRLRLQVRPLLQSYSVTVLLILVLARGPGEHRHCQ